MGLIRRRMPLFVYLSKVSCPRLTLPLFFLILLPGLHDVTGLAAAHPSAMMLFSSTCPQTTTLSDNSLAPTKSWDQISFFSFSWLTLAVLSQRYESKTGHEQEHLHQGWWGFAMWPTFLFKNLSGVEDTCLHQERSYGWWWWSIANLID